MWAIHWSQVGGTAFQWYISCSVWALASAWENECDKEDSRCPYNHDPEKVAICKQFLKGSCSNLDCRLTHKVISEQFPDCLNFLLGFCTLEGCPYRHVNVSPNTPICDGFLKEFLLMVISVIKRHTYVCAQYASTGYCSERSTCKLQHPKKKIKSKPPSNSHKKSGECRNCYLVSLGDLDRFQSPSTAVDLKWWSKPVWAESILCLGPCVMALVHSESSSQACSENRGIKCIFWTTDRNHDFYENRHKLVTPSKLWASKSLRWAEEAAT